MKTINIYQPVTDIFSYIRSNQLNRITSIEINKYLTLMKIIRYKRMTTFFQPIFSLQEEKTLGYEALNRPPLSKSFPSTEKFYDFIGKTNQVFKIDLLCRNQALTKFYQSSLSNPWHKDRLLFLNVHPQVLMDSDYKTGETMKLLQDYNIQPHQIIFEITEKQSVTDYLMFERVLSNYRSQGFRIAVDDAGSGFNSLKALVHLTPEFLKVDRSLIHNIHISKSQQKMVSLLLDFANETGTKLIAEGIEQKEDLLYLKKMGVHYGQGYALAKPSEIIFS
ncbi:EAL domain-containing protein [Evansella tamaricis]|uniref:EAL domain-containing protein n=1 Tax=Evansella tamaricis TaxID=2069301 RepID=A0ABS6JDA2_9BACI|nr:EAL domain-containing protein [Evansella tamaricis]MBU9711551.1 EAL domain-containing protein [Evansella tamaricis]